MPKTNPDAVPYATAVLFSQLEKILNARFKGSPQWMCPPYALDNIEARIEIQHELDDYLNACQRETPAAANRFTP